jgi:hypothetical protein
MKQEHKWDSHFSKINWSTKEINHNEMRDAIDMVKTELNKNVLKILKIMKRNPRVFRLELDDQSVLRFDRFRYEAGRLNMIRLQEIVLEKYNCIAKIITYKKIGRKLLQLSEWVDGYLLAEVAHNEKVMRKTGEMFAKLNNILDPKTGLFITIGEINNTSMIWTEDEKPVIIDLGTIRALKTNGIDEVVLKNLVKRIQYKDRADMFLEGYSKYRDIDGILKLANESNWSWGKRKIKPAKEKDGHTK